MFSGEEKSVKEVLHAWKDNPNVSALIACVLTEDGKGTGNVEIKGDYETLICALRGAIEVMAKEFGKALDIDCTASDIIEDIQILADEERPHYIEDIEGMTLVYKFKDGTTGSREISPNQTEVIADVLGMRDNNGQITFMGDDSID